MVNYSPLRYPGGKSALYPIIANAIIKQKMDNCVYIEPFAGGAGIALSLLLNEVVDYIIINDVDKSVYSFWRALVSSPELFIQKIQDTPITIDEWKKQKKIFESSQKYSFEYGFATFFLNRTNRSGILTAGPIGGYKQDGNYKLDCRFNKEILIEKIKKLSSKKNQIKVYNQDIFVFMRNFLPKNNTNIFIYFDPPYFEKGKRLYLNHFFPSNHEKLRNIVRELRCYWIMTYDNHQEIQSLYSDCITKKISINYSLSNKGKGSELIIFGNELLIPPSDVISSLSKLVVFN